MLSYKKLDLEVNLLNDGSILDHNICTVDRSQYLYCNLLVVTDVYLNCYIKYCRVVPQIKPYTSECV